MTSPYPAKSPDDLLPRERFLSMSGLDFMQAVRDGRIAGPAITATMNFRVTEVAPGRVVFEGMPDFAHTNPTGALHGGWYGAILDSCMSCAVMTTVPKGSYYTTLEYRVNITRAIPLGTRVIAEGVVQHAGRSTGVARGELRGAEDGMLYATGSTTCLIMSGG
ncbi:PaaI family thioesterase [Defluviimonas sp. SAOS-178_SWC]|uniref:PaaI family thioesterase n=1 Tax=Defluviimonas sp. SAOS-178_SWC TaxID=3121287 RepID=UPI00322210C3